MSGAAPQMERALVSLDPITGCYFSYRFEHNKVSFHIDIFTVSCPRKLVAKVQNMIFMGFETVAPDVVSYFVYACRLCYYS